MTREDAFLDYWRATSAQLDAAFEEWIPRFFSGLPENQTAAIHQALDNGKRLRGCLLCLVSDALGGRRQDALPRAVAVECIQAASLIHDDFVDCDSRRRGRPAAWISYGPRKAVLLGDLIFATVLARMVKTGRDDGLALAEVIAMMAGGAWHEPLESAEFDPARSADGDRGSGLYPKVIYLKTGALFGTAARLGAISAASTQDVADLAFDMGVHLGEAYQIADDLRDLVEFNGRKHGASELALLSPAIAHFCGPEALVRNARHAGAVKPRAAALTEMIPLLRERMHQAVSARIARAVDSMDEFPDNAYTGLLRAAPSQIVRMMLHGD